MTTASPTPTLTGLSAAEVADRVAANRTNAVGASTSRSVAAIVRANVLTFFNAVLLTLFALVALTGRWQNGLFGLVVLANSGIGVVQELRAKRTLDRIAVLTAPKATVRRDGTSCEIAVADVVADDLMQLRAGDQVVADATVVAGDGLEVDEALLTGESVPVPKADGAPVRAGSLVVAGGALARVTAVGSETYANRLTAQAKRFALTHSELTAGTTRLLRWITVAMLVVGPLVLWSQFRTKDNAGWRDAITGTVGALVGMVPEGLVLLTSLAFLLGALTLARHATLVQELPAVEGLARVDVVCLDKTGTLTEGSLAVDEVRLLDGTSKADVTAVLGAFAVADPANATARALGDAYAEMAVDARTTVAFSSSRKWSAIVTGHGRHWLLGAPELLLAEGCGGGGNGSAGAGGEPPAALVETGRIAASGRRVLALLEADAAPAIGADLPARHAVALVVLTERIRADAHDTLGYFAAQGVTLKVISGDNADTVGAVAAAAGIPGVHGPQDAVDGRTLPDDISELSVIAERHSVFGRVTPQQKRALVAALQSRGHVVAMTGDGVNDALALKDADIGVAMGSGAAATRGVAQIVLLDSSFAHLPKVVAEGRRVAANVERAANLFVVKNIYSTVLALVAAITVSAYPLAPIQLTLISTVTIGVPAFFLALAPSNRRYRPGFLGRVLEFAVPVGICVALSAYTASRLARTLDAGAGSVAARPATTIAVLIVGLWTLAVLARPMTWWKWCAVGAMAVAGAVALAIPALAESVLLLHLTARRIFAGAAVGLIGAVLVEITARWAPVLAQALRPAVAGAVRRRPTRAPGRR